MPAARTLKPARSDAVFKYYEHVAREDLKEICYRLHELILDAAPDLSYDKKWDGACYYQNWICAMIVPSGNYVRFHLSHGAEVPDPSGLLEGTGKGIRHMKIHTLNEIPAEQVKEWIRHELILDARDAGTPPPEGVAPLEPATASAPATRAPAAVAPPAKKKAKAPARKTAAKKAPPKKKAAAPAKAKKAAAKKAPAKKGAKKPAKAAPKKATAKKPAGKKKAPAKKGGVKKAAPKKAAAKRAPLKKGATKTAARKAPAKRAPVKKAAKKGRAGKR